MNNLNLTFLLCFFTGCASLTKDENQSIKIETKTQNNQFIKGAQCVIQSESGSHSVLSGEISHFRRASKDLHIVCKYPGQPDAKATLISRPNVGLAGNILLGGGIGAIIDHNTGKAYTYPKWVQLTFGKSCTYDRSDESEGEPVIPRN